MKKRYQVTTTVWHCPLEYDLKRGDELEVIAENEREVCIMNTYFTGSVWVSRDDFETHCQELK